MSKEREEIIAKKIKRESDVSSSSNINREEEVVAIRSRLTVLQQGGLNTITPCAACKLLRRRCAQECPFSPYFSPQEPHKFASVHKVFGASNVSKMLMEVAENQRADAANSLVYEANVRLRDPVYGCMGAISALQHQTQALQAELNAVRADIFRYKYRNHQANIINNQSSPQLHHHAPNFISPSPELVSIAVPPPPLPPPLPLLPHHGASSSSSSVYNRPTGTGADYGTISSDENVSYFVGTTTTAEQLNSN